MKRGLSAGIELITTYDRTALSSTLVEDFIVVALVCGLFLLHACSPLVAILTLPLGVLIALAMMRVQACEADPVYRTLDATDYCRLSRVQQ